MNLYEVKFDAPTYIVLARNEYELFDLLHKKDKGFQREVDRGIIYMWDLRNIEEVEVTIISQDNPKIVFLVSH